MQRSPLARQLRVQHLSSQTLRHRGAFRVTHLNFRQSSTSAPDFTHLLRRNIAPVFDDLSPLPSYRLQLTLNDFLQPSTSPSGDVAPDSRTARSLTPLPPALPPVLPLPDTSVPLPIAHHLVYFEPAQLASQMLPDGTNPDHAPGAPFTRRMWAGGRVRYNLGQSAAADATSEKPFTLDGGRAVCAEFIRAATPKGVGANEKVFVDIERRLARASASETRELDLIMQRASSANQEVSDLLTQLQHRVRQRLWRDSEEDFGPAAIVETRRLVFMQAPLTNPSPQSATDSTESPPRKKSLQPTQAPLWTHTLTPDPRLLFRFSALTFNAHAIHLDRLWTRQSEGHPDLLFHGPLSYVFLMTLLQHHLPAGQRVASVDYRNLAPLYCGQPITFCGAPVGEGNGKWEVWAQGPEGGVAVKATAVVK